MVKNQNHHPDPVSVGLRNTASMIENAALSFDQAHLHGVMAIYAHSDVGRRVTIAATGKTVSDFTRCSYLGLDNHPAIVAGAIDNTRQSKTVHWSCARTRLNFASLGDLEHELAALFKARIITFTTVLAANMSTMPLLASGHLTKGQKPLVVFDRLAHATLAYHKPIVAAETQVETIAHNDLQALETLCKNNPLVAYVCDGVYSMGGSAPLTELKDLQDKYGLPLYIDDAHGISIKGNFGQGFARCAFPELNDRTIVAASLGKGFGASGGMVMFGSAEHELLYRRFAIAHAFSASLNTAAIGAALASCAIHRSPELSDLQVTLRARMALFDRLLPTKAASPELPIRTVMIGDEMAAVNIARLLMDQGYYVSAIFFPTVARGKAGLRVSLTAAHSEDEIQGLCDAITRIRYDIDTAY